MNRVTVAHRQKVGRVSRRTQFDHRSLAALVVACVGLHSGCSAPSNRPLPADLVLRGGRLVTEDAERPEATALAARDGRIVAVGGEADVRPLIGPKTRVVELNGRLAIPGFIESHAHFESIGRAAMILKLASAQSWVEVVQRVGEAAVGAKPGEWILGRGWHQEKWSSPPVPAVEGFPVHAALSRAAPDNPVALEHASGHAVMVNAKALELAGIDRHTPDPPGGQILHDASGEPTGLLNETAQELVQASLDRFRESSSPEERELQFHRAVQLADREVISKGITSLQDAGSTLEDVDRYATLATSGHLHVRLWVMVYDTLEKMRAGLAARRQVDTGGHLTVRAIKAYIDGALGSRGAWLLEPYSDLPTSSGLAVTDLDTLAQIAELALADDFQLCIHAIGDRGNREVLDLYQRVLSEVPDGLTRRWRIEHAQHLSPADIPRFAELGVIASMQAIHATSDAPFVVTRLGERRAAEGAYVWRKLVDSGAVVVNGTDAPVEDVDPIPNFYAMVTRRLPDGSRFYPDQVLSRDEALASMTRLAAYAAFEEEEKGTLTPGKLADVTVLSKDILRVPEEEIRSARVDFTIVGGNVVYEAPLR